MTEDMTQSRHVEEEKNGRTVNRRPELKNKERLVRIDLSVKLNVYLTIYI